MSLYPIIARNVMLPLADIALGTKISRNLKFLEKSQWWPIEKLQEYQNKKLRALIKHAYENVPYYHKTLRERRLYPDDIKTTKDLRKLPILTKKSIRENFPKYIVDKTFPKREIINSGSSGSTGEPLQYYSTKEAYSQNMAALHRGWEWMGYSIGEKYVKISLNPREDKVKRTQDRLMRCLYISGTDFSNENMERIVEKIRKFKPKIIKGVTSPLFILAKHMEKNGVDDIKPLAVTTTGEILFDNMRKCIEEQFNCKVFDEYGGEATPKVFECDTHEGYHIAAENGIIELLRDGQSVSLGERGELIITDFGNYAMPFIRYRIGDVGILSEKKCSCGRKLPLLERIEGRDTDILITPTGKFLIVHFFTGYFEWVPTVNQFQVIQDKINTLTLKLVINDKFTEYDLEKIRADIQKYIGTEIKLEIKIVDKIPLSRSGKRRFVIRNIPFDF